MSENRQTLFSRQAISFHMTAFTDIDYQKIIHRRDKKYDGRFYFGVKTTQIYCRPICPARPKPENIVIFKSCSEAEANGYRPCLRCRPEILPGSRFSDGTLNSIARALSLIETQESGNFNISKLSSKLGVSERHLRRLFQEHLGSSPLAVYNTQRLHLARQLLATTRITISSIAFAVGYQSVRQFNESFLSAYKLSPTVFRKNVAQKSTLNNQLILHLKVREPFNWQMVTSYLKRHETYGIEYVTPDQYTRFLTANSWFQVTFNTKTKSLDIAMKNIALKEIRPLLAKLKSLFDLNHVPENLPKIAHQSGIRVPGCFDPFETAVSIVLSQLVSTIQAQHKLKQLIERFGKRLGEHGSHTIYEFPAPKVLVSAPIEEIGLPKTKATAIRELAKSVNEKKIILAPYADIARTKKILLDLHGIGPWTAEMIAMRCLGDSDAFPHNDLVIAKALRAGDVKEMDWMSQRAYLTHFLWFNSWTHKGAHNEL